MDQQKKYKMYISGSCWHTPTYTHTHSQIHMRDQFPPARVQTYTYIHMCMYMGQRHVQNTLPHAHAHTWAQTVRIGTCVRGRIFICVCMRVQKVRMHAFLQMHRRMRLQGQTCTHAR